MQIRLHPSQSFWFLPGGKLHLSFSDPGPKYVNYDLLSQVEQSLISSAISTGKLIRADEDKTMKKEITSVDRKLVSRLSEDQKLTKLASEILAGHIPSIKHALYENKHPIKLYRRLQEVENSKKRPRISVLALIEQRLSEVEREIAVAIAKNSTPGASPRGVDPLTISYSDEIIEESGETVTVTVE